MKRNLELAYLTAKKRARRSYFKTGLGIFSLIAFSFALLSFFRPYYEHQNSYLPNDEATMVFSGNDVSADPLSPKEAHGKAKSFTREILSRVESKASSRWEVALLKTEGSAHVLVGPAGYDLPLLGKMPLTGGFPIPQKGDSVLLYDTDSNPESGLRTDIYGLIDSDPTHFTLKMEQRRARGVEMPFDPLSSKSVFYVMSWDTLPSSISYTYERLYLTYDLKEALSDQDSLYYTHLTFYGGGSLIPAEMANFLYPSRPYARFYPPFHALSALILTLSLTVSFFLLFAQWAKDIVSPEKERKERLSLRLMGLSSQRFTLGLLFQSALPLLCALSVVLIVYHIFMGIFQAIAGFSFYFGWTAYLCLFLPIFLTVCFKLIEGFLEFRKFE